MSSMKKTSASVALAMLAMVLALASCVGSPAAVATELPGNAGFRPSDPLPLAPELTKRVLPNGLTYYVRANGNPGGRIVMFCPNRLYPFETHGHYWRGEYHFGNTPLINYLPNPLRNRLAPHVRAYTGPGLKNLFAGLPARVVHHEVVYPGFDNVVARRPGLGRWLRRGLYAAEHTPLQVFGLSHFLVIERVA